LRSPLLPIFLIVAVDILGLTIMIPLLPFYAEHLGATPATVGILIGVYAACQLVSGPLLGRLSDRTGRKPLLIVSQAGTLIGFLIMASATNIWVMFLARVIDGATAGNLSLAQAYISDITAPEARAKSFGVIGIAFGIGFLIGPAISGFLAQYDYRYPVFAAAALSATSILATSLLLPRAKPSAEGGDGPGGKRLGLLDWAEYARYFEKPVLRGLLLQFFSFAFSFAMFTGGLALFAERRLTWGGHPFQAPQVGYTWAYAGFLGILLQGPSLGKLVKRFGEARLTTTGFAAYAAGYVMLAFTRTVPMLAASTTVAAVGTLVRPTLTSSITQAASRREQGVVLGLTQSLTSIAQIVAPPLAGLMIQHGLLTTWGISAAAVAAVGLLWSRRTG
jgi:DHA1 family tetracycline resistance protein-like MFS transporter